MQVTKISSKTMRRPLRSVADSSIHIPVAVDLTARKMGL